MIGISEYYKDLILLSKNGCSTRECIRCIWINRKMGECVLSFTPSVIWDAQKAAKKILQQIIGGKTTLKYILNKRRVDRVKK